MLGSAALAPALTAALGLVAAMTTTLPPLAALATTLAAPLMVTLVLVAAVPMVMATVTPTAALAETALTAALAEPALLAGLAGLALGRLTTLRACGVAAGRSPFARVGRRGRLRCRRSRLLGLRRPGNGVLRRMLIAHVLWCVGRARSQRCGGSKGRGNVDLGKPQGEETPRRSGFRRGTIRVRCRPGQLLFWPPGHFSPVVRGRLRFTAGDDR